MSGDYPRLRRLEGALAGTDTTTAPHPQVPMWGVEFNGSQNPDHVTVSRDEAAARRFLHALKFCGNWDASLVVDEGQGWRPVEAVTQ